MRGGRKKRTEGKLLPLSSSLLLRSLSVLLDQNTNGMLVSAAKRVIPTSLMLEDSLSLPGLPSLWAISKGV